MSKRILGLDLGTNSIGWSVVDSLGHGSFELKEKGVHVFPMGVKLEKGSESSKASERTGHRAARRLKFRRKLRKIETLKVLSGHGYCPELSIEELKNWQSQKVYPPNSAFRKWCSTSDPKNGENGVYDNPYYYRWLAATEELDIQTEEDRFKIGRAFYHIAQRRGFKSNRKDTSSEDAIGDMRDIISDLLDAEFQNIKMIEEVVAGAFPEDKDELKKVRSLLTALKKVLKNVAGVDETLVALKLVLNKRENLGVVKGDIVDLNEKMNGRTLGQYFFEDCYKSGKRIRNVHTSRDEHYLTEFEFICNKQGISEELKKQLIRAIFFQRPLKSQKGLVANCPFEPKKKRAPISHPLFEEFRMWQTLNNIKIRTMDDQVLRDLSVEEKEIIIPLFLRVKESFDFKDIAKKLTPRGQKSGYIRRDNGENILFNYRGNQTIAGCPFSAKLKNLFGQDFKQSLFGSYIGNKTDKHGNKKSEDDILHEVWHVLFSFNNEDRLKEYGVNRLGLNEDEIRKFIKINPRQGYGALSIKAIDRILPYLKNGLIYSHAVFFANLPEVIGTKAGDSEQLKADISTIIDEHKQYVLVNGCINGFVREYKDDAYKFERTYNLKDTIAFKQYLPQDLKDLSADVCSAVYNQTETKHGEYLQMNRLDERVKEYLERKYAVERNLLDKLYHPSKEETYKPAKKADDGRLYLGDPRISSIKNPVFMRALYRVRAVINELLKQGIVDTATSIHVEMAREMNDANKRTAIKNWQRNNENANKECKAKIEELLLAEEITRDATDDEILKYQLYQEQNHICPYTGGMISPCDFIGNNPKYDIEHTIPRSLACDNSQENKTLCEMSYNRDIKKNRIPYECKNHDEILPRIEHWASEAEGLGDQIERKRKASRGAATKEAKDKAIQQRLELEMKRNYLRGKYRRFTMEEVKSGFKNSQLIDTRIITKYARLYLKTVFPVVHTVNGKTTDAFRKCWGIEKNRDNHVHHTIDAVVVSCVTREQNDKLASYYHDYESYERGDPSVPRKPHFAKPWKTFTEDMTNLKNEVLVSHYAPNHLLKQTKKILRKNGIIQRNSCGKPIFQQGKTARGSLHKDAFYGKIKIGDREKYVIRVPLVHNVGGGIFGFDAKKYDKKDAKYKERKNWKTKDLERIVDETVRNKVIVAVQGRIDAGESFKEALHDPVWLNKIKGVQIKKVRCIASPKGVIPLKHHSEVSERSSSEWKQHYYVQNDVNYLIAFYEGITTKAKKIRTFICYNNFVATQNMQPHFEIASKVNAKNVECSLKHILKIGDDVLLDDSDMPELQGLELSCLSKRYYRLCGINGLDGRILLRHHMEARDDKNQDKATAVFDLMHPVSKIKISPSNLNVLVGGVDFCLSTLGVITFIDNQNA